MVEFEFQPWKKIIVHEVVKFDRQRLAKHIGMIGEIAAQEVLLKEGFDLWLHWYSLRYLYQKPPDEDKDNLQREYNLYTHRHGMSGFPS